VLSALAPNAGLYRVKAAAVSRDPEEVAAYDADPLVYRGKLPARTLQEIADTIASFETDVPRITIPLLVMVPTADQLVPPAGGRMVFERAGSPDKTLEEYAGFFHELFNEPAGDRERSLGDLAAWLAARSG
jgi:alpha-beta hydrolase superfamily lysophospholipase